MHAPVSFQDFAAASPHTDPVDRKKLLFVYRAVEDLAAERRVSAADLSILAAAWGVGGLAAPLARLGGRVSELRLDAKDAFTFEHEARYDVIVASEVMEHVPDPDALLDDIIRHLAPGGLVIVTTQNGYGPLQLSSHVRRLMGSVDGTGADHRHHYTRGKLIALFQRHGLDMYRFMNSDFILTVSKPMRRHPTWGTFDADFANLVPHWMASGWYVALRKHS